MEIDALCPSCHTRQSFSPPAAKKVAKCTSCEQNLFEFPTDNLIKSEILDQCPVCGTEHLYRQRDFNRKLGIALVVVGAILAPFTYGVSLIVLALVDWIIYRSVGEIGCCYQCGAVFRKLSRVDQLKPFNLSIYDYYRNLKPSA